MPGPLDLDWQSVSLDLTRLVSVGLTALAWVIGGLILYRVGGRVLRLPPKYVSRPEVAARAETARGLLLSVWKYVVVFAVAAALVAMMPVALLPAAAIVSGIGLVVALGVQSLFRDVIAGFSMILEGQLAVGDRVKLYGVDVEGSVEAVGLRVTVVRTGDGSRVFVPNGVITAVQNWSEAVAAQTQGRMRSARREGERPSRRADRPRDQQARPARDTRTEERRDTSVPAAVASLRDQALRERTRLVEPPESQEAEPDSDVQAAHVRDADVHDAHVPAPATLVGPADDDDMEPDEDEERDSVTDAARRPRRRRRGGRRPTGAGPRTGDRSPERDGPRTGDRSPERDVPEPIRARETVAPAEPKDVLDESPWSIE